MQKHHQKSYDSVQESTLYVLATPIGNLADITLRALAVLKRADWICAEDTRVTAQLLSAYGIQGKLLSVREHNEQQMADKVIEALRAGLVVVQVSDAGTPAICDPGAKLVQRVREAGLRVSPVVGASAVMAALSVAGISDSSFYFQGFLPPKSGERQKLLASWQEIDYPIVMFETPHRIVDTLQDMMDVYPERGLLLAREISKTFETFLTGSVAEVQTALQVDSNQSRGEMVLILHAAEKQKQADLSEQAQNIMRVLSGELPTKQAADLTAKITGENKKALYDLAIQWKNQTK